MCGQRFDRIAGGIAELQDGRYDHGVYRLFTAADFDHSLKSGMHCDVVSNAKFLCCRSTVGQVAK